MFSNDEIEWLWSELEVAMKYMDDSSFLKYTEQLREESLRSYLDYLAKYGLRFETKGYKLHLLFFNSYVSYFKYHMKEGVENCGLTWIGKVCSLGFAYKDIPSLTYSLLDDGKWVQMCPINPSKCFIGTRELFDKVLVLGGLP